MLVRLWCGSVGDRGPRTQTYVPDRAGPGRQVGGRRCWAECYLTSLLHRPAQQLRHRLRLPWPMRLLGSDREPDRLQPDLVIVDNKGVYPVRDGRHVGHAGPVEEDEISRAPCVPWAKSWNWA